MKITKLTSLILSVTMLLCILTSCSNLSVWRYGVTLYDQAGGWIQSNFAEENYVFMESEPRTRIFVVDTQDKYDEMFTENTDGLKTDFSQQVLIVYTCVMTSKNYCRIREMKITDGNLKIVYEVYSSGRPDACSPYQRWMVIRMNKVDINSIVIEKV